MAQKVVAHFLDHGIVKGTSMDVDPNKATCHIQTEGDGVVEVELARLKALFFVKDLMGRREYNETHAPKTGDLRLHGSHHVNLGFHDGERMGALMNRYPPNRPFFFVLPMDPRSNNIRILLNREALTTMEPATAGGTLAPKDAAGERLAPGAS